MDHSTDLRFRGYRKSAKPCLLSIPEVHIAFEDRHCAQGDTLIAIQLIPQLSYLFSDMPGFQPKLLPVLPNLP